MIMRLINIGAVQFQIPELLSPREPPSLNLSKYRNDMLNSLNLFLL